MHELWFQIQGVLVKYMNLKKNAKFAILAYFSYTIIMQLSLLHVLGFYY